MGDLGSIESVNASKIVRELGPLFRDEEMKSTVHAVFVRLGNPANEALISLLDADYVEVRHMAFNALMMINLSSIDEDSELANYDPSGPRVERERIRALWLKWWKEQKD